MPAAIPFLLEPRGVGPQEQASHEIILVHGFRKGPRTPEPYRLAREILEQWVKDAVAPIQPRANARVFAFDMAQVLSQGNEALSAICDELRRDIESLCGEAGAALASPATEQSTTGGFHGPRDLVLRPKQHKFRPQSVVFVAHGTGAWVVKDALTRLHNAGHALDPAGLVFLDVPEPSGLQTPVDFKTEPEINAYLGQVSKVFQVDANVSVTAGLRTRIFEIDRDFRSLAGMRYGICERIDEKTARGDDAGPRFTYNLLLWEVNIWMSASPILTFEKTKKKSLMSGVAKSLKIGKASKEEQPGTPVEKLRRLLLAQSLEEAISLEWLTRFPLGISPTSIDIPIGLSSGGSSIHSRRSSRAPLSIRTNLGPGVDYYSPATAQWSDSTAVDTPNECAVFPREPDSSQAIAVPSSSSDPSSVPTRHDHPHTRHLLPQLPEDDEDEEVLETEKHIPRADMARNLKESFARVTAQRDAAALELANTDDDHNNNMANLDLANALRRLESILAQQTEVLGKKNPGTLITQREVISTSLQVGLWRGVPLDQLSPADISALDELATDTQVSLEKLLGRRDLEVLRALGLVVNLRSGLYTWGRMDWDTVVEAARTLEERVVEVGDEMVVAGANGSRKLMVMEALWIWFKAARKVAIHQGVGDADNALTRLWDYTKTLGPAKADVDELERLQEEISWEMEEIERDRKT
ncbi:hypothetical protein F4778DRAFT_240044 [Xylariomycetidae sp. FL2044]|nr:hypothetical protein F4778DRAFT_240044 [Xylariomycetidae sp. FL2044]